LVPSDSGPGFTSVSTHSPPKHKTTNQQVETKTLRDSEVPSTSDDPVRKDQCTTRRETPKASSGLSMTEWESEQMTDEFLCADSESLFVPYEEVGTSPGLEETGVREKLKSFTDARKDSPSPSTGTTWVPETGGKLSNLSTLSRSRLEIPTGATNCLAGMRFSATGTNPSLTRSKIWLLVNMYGGDLRQRASTKITYVVLGMNPSPKELEVIEKHGLETIDEIGFLDLIRTLPGKPPMSNASKIANEATISARSGSVETSTGGTPVPKQASTSYASHQSSPSSTAGDEEEDSSEKHCLAGYNFYFPGNITIRPSADPRELVKQHSGTITKSLIANSLVVLGETVMGPYLADIARNRDLIMIITEKGLSTIVDRLSTKGKKEPRKLVVREVLQSEAENVQRLLGAGRKASSPDTGIYSP
jgi:BRCT domain type II-containing protein